MPLPDVAFVCHAYHRGGVTRWMVDAAVAWRELGGRAWLLAPTPNNKGDGSSRPSVVRLALDSSASARPEIVTWPLDTVFEFGTGRHRAFTYATAIERSIPRGVPLIVSDDPAVWAGAAVLCGRNPLVGVVHSDEATYYGYVRRYGRDASGVVCVSRRITERVTQLVGRTDVPIATIPCGVPVSAASRAPNEGADAVPRMAWVGRMEEASKRVSDLSKIALALRDGGLSFHIDIVGDGPARPALIEDIARHGLTQNLTLHGWRDRADILTILERADVFLFPSNFEGMSVSVMEALAAGCAVVSTRTSGIEDYASDDRTVRCVWTYPVGDVAAAVRCVREALAVPRDERRMRSLAFAQSEFSIEQCVKAYAEFLGRLRLPERGTGSKSSRAIRARLNAMASRPIAALRSARVARSSP